MKLRSSIVLAVIVFFPFGAKAEEAICDVDAPAAESRGRVPEGLSASDWSSIRAAYEAHRHAALTVENGYQARNPGQQWRTRFDGRGFVTAPDAGGWSWGLDLVSYGVEGAETVVASPSCMEANGQRVAYQWGEALTEWYVNDQRGLEHGYTVHERPEGSAGILQLTLAVRGDLHPQVSGDGRDVAFISTSGAAVVNYSGLKVFDADGTAVPAWFEPASEGLRLSVDDRSARYPLSIDPIAQQAYLKASNTEANDNFGFSVAASGDTVVVGAPNEDSNATGVNGNQADNSASASGAVYVFVRSGTTWSQQAYLKASNTEGGAFGDQFGWSVAASGDTVVVGAQGEDSNATGVNGNQADNSAGGSGAAYVFVRSGTTWSQQAYLKASNTEVNDQFGWSVAASGDTVVVGAQGEDSNATGVNGNQADNSAGGSGAAYVFVRSGTTWSQQAYLKASNPDILDLFGNSVAVSGDTVMVGAYLEGSNATGVNGNQADNSAGASGAAYVFVRSGTTWSQQAYLKASNTGSIDQFGISVAMSGDTVVVGAHEERSSATGVNGDQADDSAPSSGAAYVFFRSGTTWSQQAYLKASNTGVGDNFGYSVAVSGNTLAVGARREASSATGVNGNQADDGAGSSGAAYVFIRNGTTWSQQAYLKASNTSGSDQFGYSVAASGDTVVVGAYQEDSNATGVNGNQADNSAGASGAAYVFVVDTDGDGVGDDSDNCPLVANPGQENADSDPIGDACDPCTDSDGDGVGNPGFNNAGCVFPNVDDNCPLLPNPTQLDTNGDGIGDFCQLCPGGPINNDDDDGDAIPDSCDRCPGFPDQPDTDLDGVPDDCDACPGFDDNQDPDADGVPSDCDNCPLSDNGPLQGPNNQLDSDADTIGDVCDTCTDSDGDGVGNAGFVNTTCPVNNGPDICPGFDDNANADGDSAPDDCDGCPNDPAKIAPGVCGCGVADNDIDADGTANCNDGCPTNPAKTSPGLCGCDEPDPDTTPPVITCPNDIVLNATTSSIASYTPTATDNCDPSPVVTADIPSGFSFTLEATTVTVTARDASGNTSTCTFIVSVSSPPAGQAAPEQSQLCLLLSLFFRVPICGMGCPLAIMGSFVMLCAMKTGLRRRRNR